LSSLRRQKQHEFLPEARRIHCELREAIPTIQGFEIAEAILLSGESKKSGPAMTLTILSFTGYYWCGR